MSDTPEKLPNVLAEVLTPQQLVVWEIVQNMQKQLLDFCQEHHICLTASVSLRGELDDQQWVSSHVNTSGSEVASKDVTAKTIMRDIEAGHMPAEMGGVMALIHAEPTMAAHLGLTLLHHWRGHQEEPGEEHPLLQDLKTAFGSLDNAVVPTPAMLVLLRYTLHELAGQLTDEELTSRRFTLQDARDVLEGLTPYSWLELFREDYRDQVPDLEAMQQELARLADASADKWATVYSVHRSALLAAMNDDDDDDEEEDEDDDE